MPCRSVFRLLYLQKFPGCIYFRRANKQFQDCQFGVQSLYMQCLGYQFLLKQGRDFLLVLSRLLDNYI